MGLPPAWQLQQMAQNQPAPLPPDVLHHNESSAKAEALLKDRLGSEWDLFQRTGTIVRSSKRWPAIDYHLKRGEKVQVVDRGRVRTILCVVPARGEPEADRLMTILDLIETDERRLWQMGKASQHELASFNGWDFLVMVSAVAGFAGIVISLIALVRHCASSGCLP